MALTVGQALSNLTTLSKLVSNGESGDNVKIGLMKMSDGHERIVKFDAGKAMTDEMKKSCQDLQKKISEWSNTVAGSNEWKNFNDNVQRLCELNVESLKNMLESSGFNLEQFKDVSFAKGKPLSFEATKKALLSDVRFTYHQREESDDGITIGKAVAKRSTFSNVLHAIGRGIMTATHALKALFTGKVFSKAWGKTVNDYKTLAGAADANEKWQLPDLDENSIGFDAHVVASACGLSGKLEVRPFAKGMKLFPEGSPSIGDIKQDPSLQDCWFLSSLASVLRSQGPGYIKGLIDTKNAPPGSAFVRLGQHRYRVPLGDVLSGGKQVASNSKPWVRLLEQAMAMHVYQHEIESVQPEAAKIKMSFRDAMNGIDALLGKPMQEGVNATDNIASQTRIPTFEVLVRAFANGARPVVLGSAGGGRGMIGSLGTGISPGHACAVLGVDKENKRLTVLDPYGHVRNVSASDLKYFTMVHVDDSRWNKAMGKGSDHNVDKSTDIINVQIDDKDGDDF